ncbi:GNAT family N-acetyltransferase [Gammaproteobacteria bacterium]|nr:GNAT family N-acetyltransferase [Gammaproteobacteria bacterium]
MSVRVEIAKGAAIAPWITQLTRLRMAVFRDFPYLYDGDADYEAEYLSVLCRSERAVVVLALDGDDAVGASTGLPLLDEHEAFRRPFVVAGIDPTPMFYCGESVLLPEWRGQGIYRHFFAGREHHARTFGDYRECCFCAVQRPLDHPLRPLQYRGLDRVWQRYGYVRDEALIAQFAWRDREEAEETEKPLVFWRKTL